MNRDEYVRLFHKLELNLVAFKRLLDCDEEVLKLVNAAIAAEREWQGLTDEEILEEYRQSYGDDGNLTDVYFARAIEAKLKEKNNG